MTNETTTTPALERKGTDITVPNPSDWPFPQSGTINREELEQRAQALHDDVCTGMKWGDRDETAKKYWRGRVLATASKANVKLDAGKKGKKTKAQSDKPSERTSLPPAPPPAATSQSDPPAPKSTYVAAPTHDIPTAVDPLLVNILTWPRRHATASELLFCKWLRETIKSTGSEPIIMSEGCIVASVPRPHKVGEKMQPSTTLFSCHVDTVEGTDVCPPTTVEGQPSQPQRKKLSYDPNFGLIGLEKDSIGGSLGADDGAGVWLMLKMIERKVPGTYIFHRGEEVGGVGSSAMREKCNGFLKEFECAVAFDRQDTFEVIRTQGGMECASMRFTEALCARLTAHGMQYQPSSRGVFTDTKNYRKVIPECVNVAVGYDSQHGRNETLDFAHLAALLEACCKIDWDSLPIDRDPTKPDPVPAWQGSRGYYGGGHNRDLWEDHSNDAWRAKAPAKPEPKTKQPKLTLVEELSICSLTEIEDWVQDSPLEAATAIGKLLVEIGSLRGANKAMLELLGFSDD